MKRNLFIVVAIFLGIIATLLLGNIIVIGDKIGRLTHVYIEYGFYAILLLLAITYLVRPIIKVHRAPEIPALKVGDDWNAEKLYSFGKRLAKDCDYIADKDLRKAHQKELSDRLAFNCCDEAPLRTIITEEIALRMEGDETLNVLGINRRIKEWGKTVFMVTAISQNSKFDTIAVLAMNYRLISDIVAASGFRPTRPQMFRLYVSVLTTALVTYCASEVFNDVDGVAPFDWGGDAAVDAVADTDVELDVSDVDIDVDSDAGGFGASVMESLKKLKIPGAIVGSAVDGCANALMTLRIGYVTKAYLTEGASALSGIKNKRRTKRRALKDSFKSMPYVVTSGSAAVGKGVGSVLTGLFKEESHD